MLVVGGAGYIGSHAARALRSRGFDVLLYDNLSSGHAALAKEFELVVGDVMQTGKLAEAMKQSQAVMHFAAHAFVGESVKNPRKYFHNNVEGGLALLNTALENGLRNVIFSSTCAVYGIPAKVPISEDAPRQPVNPYGVSKMFFEQALEAYDVAYGIRYASLRYFNAAGADESGETGECHDPETHLIPLALDAATDEGAELQVFGADYSTPDGTCIRDYIHVTDLAEAHVKALEHLIGGGNSMALNLGTGSGHSVKEVITAVEAIAGKPVRTRLGPRRAGDPPVLVADPRRAQSVLGWKAERSLTEIVSTAWQWHKRNQS
ncbi:MAG: UDP-glucose 4-epimerase GalE [Candidatus Sulfotelmatobacter sp.]